MSAGVIGAALFALGAVLIAAAGHPFLTYPLSLRLLARLRPRPLAARQCPPDTTAALCVCFYNEARVVHAKVANMLAARREQPGLELLAYVDAATDGTAEVLARHPEIRLVAASARLGKTAGMNALVGMTEADYIVFSDANVMFAPLAVPHLLAGFAAPSVGCVCGQLRYDAPPGATALVGGAYWRREEQLKALESDTGSVMGADGSIFAIRRALHTPPPPDLIDDLYVSLSVLCAGYRVVRQAEAIVYEPAVCGSAEEMRRKQRIACQAFNVHRALRHRLAKLSFVDRYKYISHKLLRWLVAYLLAAAMLCLLLALLFTAGWSAACLAACLGGLALAVVLRAEHGRAATCKQVLLAFAATGYGVWCSLRGERFQTWSPPASARARLSEA